MTLKQLEAEALALSQDSLVELLAKLLEHLSKIGDIDREVERVWIQEAEERDSDLESLETTGIPADTVLEQLRASFS